MSTIATYSEIMCMKLFRFLFACLLLILATGCSTWNERYLLVEVTSVANPDKKEAKVLFKMTYYGDFIDGAYMSTSRIWLDEISVRLFANYDKVDSYVSGRCSPDEVIIFRGDNLRLLPFSSGQSFTYETDFFDRYKGLEKAMNFCDIAYSWSYYFSVDDDYETKMIGDTTILYAGQKEPITQTYKIPIMERKLNN